MFTSESQLQFGTWLGALFWCRNGRTCYFIYITQREHGAARYFNDISLSFAGDALW